jgi:hypothetical protein
VAADLRQSQQSVTGAKLPGGSNSAQDLAAGAKHGSGHPSTIGMLVAAEAAGEAVQHVAGPIGRAFGMVAVPVLSAMRQAGLHKVDDLAAEAMPNPGLASALLAKVPRAAGARGYGVLLGQQIRALGVTAAERSGSSQRAPLSSSGSDFATPATAPCVSIGVR